MPVIDIEQPAAGADSSGIGMTLPTAPLQRKYLVPPRRSAPSDALLDVAGNLAGRSAAPRPDDLASARTAIGNPHDVPAVPRREAGPQIPLVGRAPTPPRPDFEHELLQLWEGNVIDVGAATFRAELRDLTCPANARERAVFSNREVSAGDLPLLAPGAVFYWSIGYEKQLTTGQTRKVSLIRMQRLPSWSRRELDEARREAAEMAKGLGVRAGASE